MNPIRFGFDSISSQARPSVQEKIRHAEVTPADVGLTAGTPVTVSGDDTYRLVQLRSRHAHRIGDPHRETHLPDHLKGFLQRLRTVFLQQRGLAERSLIEEMSSRG